MSPERNEPCPCGSGKKYKRCCGNAEVNADPFTLNRNAAYVGETGRRRRQFCLEYTAYKKALLAQEENMLRARVVAQGESISCKRGCANSKCCSLYVFTTLQEAECITYYLYQHETTLKHFITAYRDWRRGLGSFEHKLQHLDQMMAKNLNLGGGLSAEEQEQFRSDINDYTARKAACPFLIDNACSIYEVRPFSCAGMVAVTPAERCSWDPSDSNRAKCYKVELKLEQEMPYFVQSRSPILFGCLPELVHRLLEQGYSFLSGIEGLEELRDSIPGRSF